MLKSSGLFEDGDCALEFEDTSTTSNSSEGTDHSIVNAAAWEPAHGPWHWNNRSSIQLQKVIDSFRIDELYDMGFSVTVGDPKQPDCPLVACSVGFTELCGYSVPEIIGRNCRFLLQGVPADLLVENTRMKCRAFCASSSQGEEYRGDDTLPAELKQEPWVELNPGEMICMQTNAKKTGELFRNMFYMKQVELNEELFILGLQAAMPEEVDVDSEGPMSDLARRCQLAFRQLEENMSMIEQVLAQQFWYSAQMRRQG